MNEYYSDNTANAELSCHAVTGHQKLFELLAGMSEAGKELCTVQNMCPLSLIACTIKKRIESDHMRQVNEFKEKNRALSHPEDIGSDIQQKGTFPKPMSRHRHQELMILETIRKLGFDPKGIPRHTPGQPGLKAVVRSCLSHYSKDVFMKAWKRCRKAGEIQNA